MGSKRKRAAKDGLAPGSKLAKKAKLDSPPDTKPPTSSKPNFDRIPFIETPTGDERKREAQLYDLLGSEDEVIRLQAAECIISCLLEGSGSSEEVVQRHLNRRLFRGLASGRNASRVGFSLIITELLSQLFGEKDLAKAKYPGLTFDKVLGFLTEKVEVLGNIPGQEERDHFFGQIFGLECFVKARILFRETSRWNAVLDQLLKLSSKKVSFRSQSGWVLLKAMEQMNQEQTETTLRRVANAGLAKSSEGIAFWLVALGQYPDLKVKPWGDPLSKKSHGDIAAILKENFQEPAGAAGGSAGAKGPANWTAQLHFVWELILSYYSEGDMGDAHDFKQFWNRVVDDGLFSKNATDGQKFKGFTVFQAFVEGLIKHHDKLRVLFSKNLMACLMNQAAKEDRYLHRAATKALKALESIGFSHPLALAPMLDGLLGENGAYNFDQRTSSKTIDRLLQNVNHANAPEVLGVIRQPMRSLSKQDEKSMQTILRTYIHYLSKLLDEPTKARAEGTPPTEEDIFGHVLRELSLIAYSQPDGIPPMALSSQVKDLCRTRLESSLAKMSRRSDDFETVCRAVQSIDPTSMAMDDTIKTALSNASSRMQKLLKRKTHNQTQKELARALAMLHAVSIFQLYNEDPDAMEVLSDLAQYSDRIKKGNVGAPEEGSSEFLVEILLSMVARPSSLMRQVAQQVFETFTSQVSAGALRLLIDPLASGESAKGQKELFNTEEDDVGAGEDGDESSDDDDNDDDDDVVEVGSDVEFVELSGRDAGEDDSEENDEDEDKTMNGDENPHQDLDELLETILKSHRLDKDGDAESSSSDGDMSDSEMLAQDEKLAEIFKHRASGKPDTKKQKKDAKQSVVNFKHRILDLLDIYVKNETLNPLAFRILCPLLRLMRSTSTKALSSRACEIILNYQRGLKKARANSSSKEAAQVLPDTDMTLLIEIHREAGKDNSHAYAKAASAASLIVASAMVARERESIRQVAAVYAKTQSDWVLGEAKLQNSFFADWNNWCQNHASHASSG